MKKEKKNQDKPQATKQTPANQDRPSKPISYRLKCAKAGNGLSHYVMYGDEKGSLL